MSDEERETEREATRWIRREPNKRTIISKFADPNTYPPTEHPLVTFMAGSPGAGKSEFVKSFKQSLEEITKARPVVIDPDAVREFLPGYTGKNSYLFQRPISIGVDDLFSFSLKHNQNIIVDGTFSDYTRARANVVRVLNKYGVIIILYVIQSPEIAWAFTQLREVTEGRNIRKEDFISRFIGAKETVDKIKLEFKDRIRLNVIQKDYKDTKTNKQIANVFPNVKSIDECITFRYNKSDIERSIHA